MHFTSAIAQKIMSFLLLCYSELVQGKLIEIHFTTFGKISGAKIQTCKHVEIEKIANIT